MQIQHCELAAGFPGRKCHVLRNGIQQEKPIPRGVEALMMATARRPEDDEEMRQAVNARLVGAGFITKLPAVDAYGEFRGSGPFRAGKPAPTIEILGRCKGDGVVHRTGRHDDVISEPRPRKARKRVSVEVR
jgi:hypothetical protein